MNYSTLLKRFPYSIYYCKYSIGNVKVNSGVGKTDFLSFSHPEPSFAKDILNTFKIHVEFITEREEEELMKDVEPKLKRQRYQFDHWDDAIHGFRETETVNWNSNNSSTLQRLRTKVFADVDQLPHTHILDLAEDGYIKPHVDSTRYCGDTIAGISLLSDCVMRLVHTANHSYVVDILIPRRSLYVMSHAARYNYTHEILKNSESVFNGSKVHKGRRVSIICRSSPGNNNCASE